MKKVAVLMAWMLLSLPSVGRAQETAVYLKSGSFDLPPSKNNPSAMQDPVGIAVTPDGTIYILDQKGKIGVFSKTGEQQNVLTSPKIPRPLLVAVSPSGDLVIVDGKEKTINTMSPDGEVLATFAGAGSNLGELDDPISLAVGQNAFIYVLDAGCKGISIFSGDGLFIRRLLLDTILQKPTAITVDAEGSMYVCDAVQIGVFFKLPPFDQIAYAPTVPFKVVTKINIKGRASKDQVAMAAGTNGAILSLDALLGKLWMKRPGVPADQNEDNYIYGKQGTGFSAFAKPTAMAMATADEMVILDSELRKVERIQLPGGADQKVKPIFSRIRAGFSGPSQQPGILLALDRDSTGVTGFFFEKDGKSVVRQKVARSLQRTYDGDTILVSHPELQADETLYAQDFAGIGGVAVWDSLVAVTDQGHDRVAIMHKRTGELIQSFGNEWKPPQRFKEPQGVAIDPTGRVIIADNGTNNVRIMSKDWATMKEVSFVKPVGVAVDRAGCIYIWGVEPNSLSRVPKNGGIEKLNGSFFPARVGGLTFDPYGNAFVLDLDSKQILVLDIENKTTLLSLGPADRYAKPVGLLAGPAGDVYLSDRAANVTHVFRWSVSALPVDQISVTYHDTGISVGWPATTDKYLWGYEVNGRAASGETVRLGRVRASQYQWSLPDSGGMILREVSVAPVSISGKIGGSSPAVPLPGLQALTQVKTGGYASAASAAEETMRQLEPDSTTGSQPSAGSAVEVHADSSVFKTLRLARFFHACEKHQQDEILRQGPPLRNSIPASLQVTYHRVLADGYMNTGKLDLAASEIRLLGAASVAQTTPVLSDSSFVERCFRISDAKWAEKDTTGALKFLKNFRGSFPDSALKKVADLDQRLVAAEARQKFARGVTLWSTAKYKEAAQYFETALADSTANLGPREKTLLLQLLAVNLLEEKKKDDAKTQFLKVYEVNPGFDLEVEATKMFRYYGFVLYSPEALEFFKKARAVKEEGAGGK